MEGVRRAARRSAGSAASVRAWSRCRAKGCAPIVKAAEQGHKEVQTPWPDVRTNVFGVRVKKPLGDYLILRVVYESKGFGSAVSDEDVEQTRASIAEADGVMLSPEGAMCVAAYRDAVKSGKVKKDERAVVFNTATGLRTSMGAIKHHIDPSQPIEYAKL